MRFDDFFYEHTPRVDTSWTCRWFLMILWLGGCGAASGALAGTELGALAAILCLGLIVYAVSLRTSKDRCAS